MTAEEVLDSQTSSWGHRESYLITEEEFAVLLKEKVEIEKLNVPNGDGTFLSSLLFRGYRFIFTSATEIGGSS